jgi:hypothetical protein
MVGEWLTTCGWHHLLPQNCLCSGQVACALNVDKTWSVPQHRELCWPCLLCNPCCGQMDQLLVTWLEERRGLVLDVPFNPALRTNTRDLELGPNMITPNLELSPLLDVPGPINTAGPGGCWQTMIYCPQSWSSWWQVQSKNLCLCQCAKHMVSYQRQGGYSLACEVWKSIVSDPQSWMQQVAIGFLGWRRG